jgi:hypothetical protein
MLSLQESRTFSKRGVQNRMRVAKDHTTQTKVNKPRRSSGNPTAGIGSSLEKSVLCRALILTNSIDTQRFLGVCDWERRDDKEREGILGHPLAKRKNAILFWWSHEQYRATLKRTLRCCIPISEGVAMDRGTAVKDGNHSELYRTATRSRILSGEEGV